MNQNELNIDSIPLNSPSICISYANMNTTNTDVLNIFKRITDENCLKLGFSPEFCRPEWLICTVLPVPPPAVRPSVKQDNNQRSDDDLTYKLIDIVKANAKLKEKLDAGHTDYIDEHIAVVQYHVATLVNNDQPFGAGVPQANVQRQEEH